VRWQRLVCKRRFFWVELRSDVRVRVHSALIALARPTGRWWLTTAACATATAQRASIAARCVVVMRTLIRTLSRHDFARIASIWRNVTVSDRRDATCVCLTLRSSVFVRPARPAEVHVCREAGRILQELLNVLFVKTRPMFACSRCYVITRAAFFAHQSEKRRCF
jgi:hypothetical protein